MNIFLNTNDLRYGGPNIWSRRFRGSLIQRGFQITNNLRSDWSAALFINQSNGIEEALQQGPTVGFRVANGYMPEWFAATGRTMRTSHHALNASTAHALEIADVVIYQSQWAKGELDRHLYERQNRFAVLYNGVDLAQFSPGNLSGDDVPVIGTAGRMRYRYRLEMIFEMSRRLDVPHQLLIVGEMDDECRTVYREYLQDRGMHARTVYQRQVPPEALADYYRRMRVFVHPVCGDVCPNVVIEAMACGVPTVAPRYGGAAELIAGGGVIFDCKPWIYDQHFVQSMCSAVKEALSQSETMSAIARRIAEDRFDIQSMTDHYLNLLGLPVRLNQDVIKGDQPGD